MGRLAFARLLVKNAAIAEAGHPHRCHLERHRDARNHERFRLRAVGALSPSWVDIVLAGTPESAAHAAGELCEQGPHLMKPYEPKVVLDRLKGLLAARASHES
jgi:hypothetical protein